eukprot:2869011-Amphidinium_carterae.2
MVVPEGELLQVTTPREDYKGPQFDSMNDNVVGFSQTIELRVTEMMQEIKTISDQGRQQTEALVRAFQTRSSLRSTQTLLYRSAGGVFPNMPLLVRTGKSDRTMTMDGTGAASMNLLHDVGGEGRLEFDQIKLTPISELHIHREPYEEPPQNPDV